MGTKRSKAVGVRLDDVQQWLLEHLAVKLAFTEAEVMRKALEYYAEKNDLRTDRAWILERVRGGGQLSDYDDYHPGK